MMPEGSFSVTCQNDDGDTVFSLSISGEDGIDMENFQLPELDGESIDFDSLDCQFNSDAAADNGDL